MSGSRMKGLLKRVSRDEVPELSGAAEELYVVAMALVEPGDVFAKQDARARLLETARVFMASARKVHETVMKGRTWKMAKHELPAVRPELIFDPDTGLYDVILENSTTHHGLDVIGEREKIRLAAAETGGKE